MSFLAQQGSLSIRQRSVDICINQYHPCMTLCAMHLSKFLHCTSICQIQAIFFVQFSGYQESSINSHHKKVLKIAKERWSY